MKDDHETESNSQPSWLTRLSQALSREPQDREQLIQFLRDAEDRNLLDADALTMIEGVLQVSVMRARDIMIPKRQMVVIENDKLLDDILPVVIESAHSRFPVVDDKHEEVLGILLAKDLLTYFSQGSNRQFAITDIMRKPIFVPESKRLDVLLREFRLTHNHMAIVVDEYGGIAGLITIEDVLEQIVGEIEDEHDFEEESNILKHSETKYIVKALTSIQDFNEYFEDNISDEEYDTVAGLVMSLFGHLPKRGEITSYGRYDFKILNASKRRINLLQVRVQK